MEDRVFIILPSSRRQARAVLLHKMDALVAECSPHTAFTCSRSLTKKRRSDTWSPNVSVFTCTMTFVEKGGAVYGAPVWLYSHVPCFQNRQATLVAPATLSSHVLCSFAKTPSATWPPRRACIHMHLDFSRKLHPTLASPSAVAVTCILHLRKIDLLDPVAPIY